MMTLRMNEDFTLEQLFLLLFLYFVSNWALLREKSNVNNCCFFLEVVIFFIELSVFKTHLDVPFVLNPTNQCYLLLVTYYDPCRHIQETNVNQRMFLTSSLKRGGPKLETSTLERMENADCQQRGVKCCWSLTHGFLAHSLMEIWLSSL